MGALNYSKRGQTMSQNKFDLDIKGMTCAACSARLERVLNKIDGVEASVNLAAETAHITSVNPEVGLERILQTIEKTGFEATELINIDQEQKSLDKEQEYRKLLLKFSIALIVTLPFVFEMIFMLLGVHPWHLPAWAQLLLASIVQFYAGARFYKGAYKSLAGGGANMDVLVVLGTSAAYLLSLGVMILHLSQHLYFEASASVITLVLLGKLLELRAKAKTGFAISKLLHLQPKIALVERDGITQEISIEDLHVNDIFIVKAGQSIPTDGIVLEGNSLVDESMMTGESLPVLKSQNDKVVGATKNGDGMLTCKAIKVGSDTFLASIVKLIEEAQGSKAPIQRLADTIAGIFVPAVVGIAVVTLFVWWLISYDFELSLINAVAVLVIACPCALGLATPTAIMVGVGRGASEGILIKNAEVLENVGKITAVVFDKTGTLTYADIKVNSLLTQSTTVSENDLLALSSALEKGSNHPLAKAIVQASQKASNSDYEVTNFQNYSGLGIAGDIKGKRYFAGSIHFITQMTGLKSNDAAETFLRSGNSIVALATEEEILGYIALSDTIRKSAKAAIAKLQAKHVEVYMLTGDNRISAQTVADSLGIQHVFSEVLPSEKADKIMQLKQEGKFVCMVGDGINDAPALALADVAVAMAQGSDIAIESADIILTQNDPMNVLHAIDLSLATMSKIKQNLFLAFVYNTLAIPLAFLGMLSPVVAGAAMAMSSVSVVSNSLLLRQWKVK